MAIRDKYLTVTQAAKQLGVSRQTVYRWIANGGIKADKLGREMFIDKSALKRFEDEQEFEETYNWFLQSLVNRIQQEFDYTDGVAMQYIDYDKKKQTVTFIVKGKNNERERVVVHLGTLERISNEGKREPFVLIGLKYPIKKIIREKVKEEIVKK